MVKGLSVLIVVRHCGKQLEFDILRTGPWQQYLRQNCKRHGCWVQVIILRYFSLEYDLLLEMIPLWLQWQR